MSKTNLTITVDKNLLRSMKIIAAQNDTSVTRLLVEMMEARAKQDPNYERAKKRAIARMEKGWDLGFKPGPREELHER
jgi:hypothetical protein